MGGGGTFMYALHHPELFSSACPLSASCGPLTLEEMNRRLDRRGTQVDSEEQKEAYFKQHVHWPLSTTYQQNSFNL